MAVNYGYQRYGGGFMPTRDSVSFATRALGNLLGQRFNPDVQQDMIQNMSDFWDQRGGGFTGGWQGRWLDRRYDPHLLDPNIVGPGRYDLDNVYFYQAGQDPGMQHLQQEIQRRQEEQFRSYIQQLTESGFSPEESYNIATERLRPQQPAPQRPLGGVGSGPPLSYYNPHIPSYCNPHIPSYYNPHIQQYERGGEIEPNKQLSQLLDMIGMERAKGEVPVMAHEGEFVVNREAADAVGRERLETLNKVAQMPSREQGGPVFGGARPETGQYHAEVDPNSGEGVLLQHGGQYFYVSPETADRMIEQGASSVPAALAATVMNQMQAGYTPPAVQESPPMTPSERRSLQWASGLGGESRQAEGGPAPEAIPGPGVQTFDNRAELRAHNAVEEMLASLGGSPLGVLSNLFGLSRIGDSRDNLLSTDVRPQTYEQHTQPLHAVPVSEEEIARQAIEESLREQGVVQGTWVTRPPVTREAALDSGQGEVHTPPADDAVAPRRDETTPEPPRPEPTPERPEETPERIPAPEPTAPSVPTPAPRPPQEQREIPPPPPLMPGTPYRQRHHSLGMDMDWLQGASPEDAMSYMHQVAMNRETPQLTRQQREAGAAHPLMPYGDQLFNQMLGQYRDVATTPDTLRHAAAQADTAEAGAEVATRTVDASVSLKNSQARKAAIDANFAEFSESMRRELLEYEVSQAALHNKNYQRILESNLANENAQTQLYLAQAANLQAQNDTLGGLSLTDMLKLQGLGTDVYQSHLDNTRNQITALRQAYEQATKQQKGVIEDQLFAASLTYSWLVDPEMMEQQGLDYWFDQAGVSQNTRENNPERASADLVKRFGFTPEQLEQMRNAVRNTLRFRSGISPFGTPVTPGAMGAVGGDEESLELAQQILGERIGEESASRGF